MIDYDEKNVETFQKITTIIQRQDFYPKIKKQALNGVLSILTLTLYSGIYLNKKAGSLLICVIFNNNLILAEGIKKIILDVYNHDRIIFTSDVLAADLVISDSYENIDPQTEHFYFDEQLNPEQWGKMIDMINQIFYKELFLSL